MEFRAHRFTFRCRLHGKVLLNEHKGSALRGVFGESVRSYCERKELLSCHPCHLLEHCPVAHLVSPMDETGRRGADVPRPYTIEPPIDSRSEYEDGSPFAFGITLYGKEVRQLRVIIAALRNRERLSLGRKTLQGNGFHSQGSLSVEEVLSCHPLSGIEAVVMRSSDGMAMMPDFGITHDAVLLRAAASGEIARLTIQFLTPARIIERGRLVRQPLMRPLLQRLVERISSLWESYADGTPPLDFAQLMAAADQVHTVHDETHWVDLQSYSSRRDTRTPIGGFVGRAVFEGPLQQLLPWLIWGEYTHVGKNAVKGDGWYRLEA